MTEKNNALELRKENFELAQKDMFEVLNPAEIASLADAELLIDMATVASDRLQLRGYRAMLVVLDNELWKGIKNEQTGKYEGGYKSFEEWAQKVKDLGKTQAYTTAKAAKLINEDGAHSKFYREEWGAKDFTISHLVEFVTNKALFKDDKKETEKTVQKWELETDENGAPKWVDDKGTPRKVWRKTKDKCTYLEMLIESGAITPAVSVKKLQEILARGVTFGKFGFEVAPKITTPKAESKKKVEEGEKPANELHEIAEDGAGVQSTEQPADEVKIPQITLHIDQTERATLETLLKFVAKSEVMTKAEKELAKKLEKQLPKIAE